MKNKKKLIPFIAIALMCIVFIFIDKITGEPLSVHTIIKYTPKDPILAAIVILFLYALKSLTVVFPLAILYLASGIIFPTWIAILINILGLAITFTIPYWIGRYFGDEAIEEIYTRFPKVKEVTKYQNSNAFFACFITRIVGFLPGDIVSIYFGACNTNFPVYLIGGISGCLLSIITTTIIGEKLNNPFTKEFLVVLLIRIIVIIGAILLNKKIKSTK